jgi:alanine racemase
MTSHPAWIQVDLEAITSNVRAISAFVGPDVEVMAVVKANGYGHGLEQAAGAALSGGAACLGVANPDEGIRLRQSGVTSPIVILGATLPHAAAAIIEADLSATVSSLPVLLALQSEAEHHNKTARVHLKLETGMGRVGTYLEETIEILQACERNSRIEVEGISTHVGWGLGEQSWEITAQIRAFTGALGTLLGHLQKPPRWVHAANSLVTAAEPSAHFNLIRAGLLTYGISPSQQLPDTHPILEPLNPALSIHARLTQIRTLRTGQPVSYGGTTVVDRETTAAIVPVGYGDGYPRYPLGGGDVLFGDHRCPILGTVCMDQMVIDITGRPADVGDEIILLGASSNKQITASDLAAASGRLSYEMVTGLVARLPFVYTS